MTFSFLSELKKTCCLFSQSTVLAILFDQLIGLQPLLYSQCVFLSIIYTMIVCPASVYDLTVIVACFNVESANVQFDRCCYFPLSSNSGLKYQCGSLISFLVSDVFHFDCCSDFTTIWIHYAATNRNLLFVHPSGLIQALPKLYFNSDFWYRISKSYDYLIKLK